MPANEKQELALLLVLINKKIYSNYIIEINTKFIRKFVRDFKSSHEFGKEYDDYTLGLMIIKVLKRFLIPDNGIWLDPKKNKSDRVMLDIINFYIENYHNQY